MSQNDFDIANQAGAAFRADVNSALQALASLSAGASAPSTTYGYQLWYDTTNSVLKIRNGANNAWVIIGPLADSTQHVIYVNNLAKVYINSSGQMGVGVPSPGYAVDVSGDVNVTGNFKIGGTNIPSTTKFYSCGSVGGTASAITATASPTITAYAADQLFLVKIASTSTSTTPTINITSLGAKTIKKQIGGAVVALAPGDLQANTYALLAYDGTDMILVNPRAYSKGADIASAGTINLDTATGDYVFITGTTTITAVTLSEGRCCTVKFGGALTLTNGASLILPGGANITTANGDTAMFRGEASGVVRCVDYQKADGSSVVSTAFNGTQVRKAATQSIPNGTITALNFDTENWDDGGWHDNVTNNTRITVNFTGRVQITANLNIVMTSNANMWVRIYKNGSEVAMSHTYSSAAITNGVTLCEEFDCTSGDYFEMYAQHNLGASANTAHGQTRFSARRTK